MSEKPGTSKYVEVYVPPCNAMINGVSASTTAGYSRPSRECHTVRRPFTDDRVGELQGFASRHQSLPYLLSRASAAGHRLRRMLVTSRGVWDSHQIAPLEPHAKPWRLLSPHLAPDRALAVMSIACESISFFGT